MSLQHAFTLLRMKTGVLKEVNAFSARIDCGDVQSNVPLTKALGFKQLRAYLRGEIKKEQAIEQSQNN